MSRKNKSLEKLPCECGHNRWKTKGNRDYAKYTDYECRKCHTIRRITKEQTLNEF